MGASNSKSERVYVYGNDVPIGFTPQLQEKLVKDAETGASKVEPPKPAASAPSDMEEKVDALVAKELARILEKNQLDDMKARDRNASTTELLNEIRDISRQIQASPSTKSPTFAKALQARDRVATCLRDNSGRALDCWSEVAEFRALTATIEKEFASGSN
ncbi:hypothetical protein H4R99_003066 [Coemansia sp. RSA 1722]|nr:hypothetical protein IWW45_001639 [Coemansia sp. RSA 485]KAJ2601247.1 hypothetical protein H4R99_003066 [Coemansia sp. RSA 1722]KAJ2701484.1 hypothetical protein FB645_004630 [Coemansia sp. IMI 203386]